MPSCEAVFTDIVPHTSTCGESGTVRSSSVTVWMKESICCFLRSLRTTSFSSSSICYGREIVDFLFVREDLRCFCLRCRRSGGLTCILSRLQWNRLSASFSWFSSSAVGGLYRSLRDNFAGWYSPSPPASSGLLLLPLTETWLSSSWFSEGTICETNKKAQQHVEAVHLTFDIKLYGSFEVR